MEALKINLFFKTPFINNKIKIMSKKLILVGSMSALALLISVPCLAATATSTYNRANHTRISARANMAPTVTGSATGISGNTIYLTGTNGTNYTIDATSAKIRKAGAIIVVSSILSGDSLSVRGTLSGTNVVATSIMDGVSAAGANGQAWSANRANFSAGTITVLNNPSFTMQTSTTTITVNTNSSTTFKNANAAASFANLAVGQRVYVNGANSSNYIAAATSVNVMAVKNATNTVKPVVKKMVKSNVKTVVKPLVKKTATQPIVKKVVKMEAKVAAKVKTAAKTVKNAVVKIVKKVIKKK
jgi:hypothetical protein